MSEVGNQEIKPQNPQEALNNQAPSKNESRWNFLKPIKSLWKRNKKEEPDDFVPDPGRRNLLKLGVIGAGGVAVIAGGGGALAERSLGTHSIEETIKVGNTEIVLSGQDFLPKEGEVDPTEVFLFLVGAPMRAKASVTWGTPRQFAEQFKVRAYTLDARPKGVYDENSLDLEVEAIRSYLTDPKKNIKKITILGHSIGVAKAVKLAALMEENNPDIKLNVVLANPMGFYAQDRGDLINRWGKEAGNEQKLVNPRASHEHPLKIGAQLAGSMAADIRQTGPGYKKWVDEQFDALTQITPELSQVKSPVVLLIGSQDLLAEESNILPEAEIRKRLPQTSAEGQLMREILASGRKWDQLSAEEQVRFGNKLMFAKIQREQIAQRGKARDKYIKEEKLPQAENIKVIVATKYATHVGFGVERADQTAHVMSKIFERLRRTSSQQSSFNKAA